MAPKRAYDTTDQLGEQFLGDPKPIVKTPEPSEFAEPLHRATAITPSISELLARVEGIQRWGLNE